MFKQLYTRAEAWLTTKAPRYWHRHAAIAVAISLVAGAAWYAGLAWAWQINVVLLVAGAVIRDIEKEDTLHAPAWWWVLLPLAVAGVSMALVHAWALAGGVFYLGREARDRERLGTWDHKGLWWPVLASLGLWLLAVVVATTINTWRTHA